VKPRVDDAVLTKFLFDNRPEAPWAGHIDGRLSMSVQHQRGVIEDLRDARRSTKAVLARERRVVYAVLLHSQGREHLRDFCPLCIACGWPQRGSPSKATNKVCNVLRRTRMDGENNVILDPEEE
jgi:hypothetical protein